jgi:proteasome assembly chaperone (PAC2) family protein
VEIVRRGKAILRRVPRRPAVRLSRRPGLERPLLVVAFEGWNDAADAASSALANLADAWQAAPFAEIDGEEFFDFTAARPELAVVDGLVREITWPATVFSATTGPPDVVLARGPEPQLRWHAYCDVFVELAAALRTKAVVLLGAYLAEVTHSRPVPLAVTGSDAALVGREGLSLSSYEGPTGIVGVLGAALADAGIPSISVWASVPCYSIPVSAKAALALAEATTRVVGRSADLGALTREARDYEHQMDELVDEDETVAAYVARIARSEGELASERSLEGLTDEIERYLRHENLE